LTVGIKCDVGAFALTWRFPASISPPDPARMNWRLLRWSALFSPRRSFASGGTAFAHAWRPKEGAGSWRAAVPRGGHGCRP